MPYDVAGCSSLALPLGELSPQVIERVLQFFALSDLTAFGHLSHEERQDALRCSGVQFLGSPFGRAVTAGD